MATSAAQAGTAAGRQQARQRKGATKPRRMSFMGKVWLFLMVLLFPLMTVGVAATAYTLYLFRVTTATLPTPDGLTDYIPGGVTEIYATDKDPKTGKLVVLGRVFSQYKEFQKFEDIPKILKNATIAVEDERFYQHVGIDARGIGRAVYRDVRDRRMGEGGSTLTQQLVRNLFASVGTKKTFNRKIQEMMLAIQMEKNFSKDEILEMYLNQVCYGANTYGVKAAAKLYFGKPVQKLTIGEAALLAGLPQRPADYELFDHLDNALERRKTVLAKMEEQGYITGHDRRLAEKTPVKIIARADPKESIFKAPYFTNYVLRQLKTTYGKDAVYHNGLKVYTTLNSQMQTEAERALVNGVLAGRGDKVTEGALICLEPHQGYIRAMVGGVDYNKNQFNNVTQGRRQPGSSFKAFVYAAAFETHKYGPDSTVNDAPRSFNGYKPQNYGGGYHGWTTLRQATAFSYNIPAVAVADDIGINRVIDTAQRMGITSPLKNPKSKHGDLSLALGSYDVSPLEMASAYSVFPNHGSHALPMAIIRVVDSEGKVLENHGASVVKAVIPESVTRDVSDMLRGVVQFGTAAGADGIQQVEEAHGKTGTTNDNKDAWFVGYTPELVTAVWVCGVKRNPKTNKVQYRPMEGITGGHVCAPIWARFMLAAVLIQRRSGETVSPVPEKNVPANLTAQDDDNRPRRRRRRRRNDDETVAATPAPEAREPKTHETDVRETPRSDETPEPKGEDPKPSNENEKPSEGEKPASGGNEPKGGGGESVPEAPPAAPKE